MDDLFDEPIKTSRVESPFDKEEKVKEGGEIVDNKVTVNFNIRPYTNILVELDDTSAEAQAKVKEKIELGLKIIDLYATGDKPKTEEVFTETVVKDTPVVLAEDKPKSVVADVKCPTCGGDCFDNRENKPNPKGPDYKCKNRSCGKAGWIRQNVKTQQEFISWSK